jgi:hypothetical protein
MLEDENRIKHKVLNGEILKLASAKRVTNSWPAFGIIKLKKEKEKKDNQIKAKTTNKHRNRVRLINNIKIN